MALDHSSRHFPSGVYRSGNGVWTWPTPEQTLHARIFGPSRQRSRLQLHHSRAAALWREVLR